jgi:hypothetical protein
MVTTVIPSTSPHKIPVGRQCSTASARDQLKFLLASNETVSSNNEIVSNNIETKCLLNSSTNTDLVDIIHHRSRNLSSLHLSEVAQLLSVTQRTLHPMQANYSIRTPGYSNIMSIKQNSLDETMSASDRGERGWKRKLGIEALCSNDTKIG